MIKRFSLSMTVLLPGLLFAQEYVRDTTAVEEVVIAENRLRIPFSKQTKNIQLITKEEIAKLPARSINEVLTYVGGVDVRQRGPFGTQTDIGIDGGSFDQTLILVNGAKVSDPQTGHHSMNIPIPLDAIERIEILRGPAARIYGVNSLTGAINIVTKQPKSSEVSMHGYSGSSFQDKEEGDGSGKYWGGGVQLGGTLVTGDLKNSLYLSTDKFNGQRYNSAAENVKLFYQGDFKVNENNKLDWSAGYITNRFGANGFYAAPTDTESYEEVTTSFVTISSQHQLSKNFFLSPRITNRNNRDDYRYFGKDNLASGRSEHENNLLSLELNSRLNTGIGDFGFGLEIRDEDIVSTNIGNHARENLGSYAEFRTERIENLIFGIGAYVNYNSQYGFQVFPGVELGYLMGENWKIAATAGKGQRIPTFTDLYLAQPKNVGNPLLESEVAKQYDALLQYRSSTFQFRLGYFYRNIEDFIDWASPDISVTPYQPFNFGNNKVHGANFNLSQQFKLSEQQILSYDVGYNYLKPMETTQYGDVLPKYTLENLKHQALLRLMYQVNAWQFMVGSRFVERELNDPYLIVDARAAYAVRAWKLYVDGTNLLNQEYKEVAAVPLPKRWFTLGTSYNIQWNK